MIRRLFILLAFVVALAGAAGSAGARDLRVSFSGSFGLSDYYDDLEPYGTWVSVSYGWAWCPLDVSASWRPYTVGRWVYTDWGWMWISADPWGSTPYHYGRWAYDDFYGWIWVPGDVWAPAWVTWRYGGEWIGWAPLPPEFGWSTSIGFRYSTYDYDRRIPSYAWCFSSGSGFLDSRVRVVPPSRNVTIIRSTRNVTRYEVIGSLPAERGLRPEFVRRATGRNVPRYSLVDSPGSRRRDPAVRGNQIAVSRPRPAGRATDRVRATPPERFRRTPERALLQRQRSERGRVTERMRQERRDLEQAQQRELRQRPRGVSEATLQRRHEAERRAQAAREERARRLYQTRQERLERPDRGATQPDRGDVRERPAGRGRGSVQERPSRNRPARQEPNEVRERRTQPARQDRNVQERPIRRERPEHGSGSVRERRSRPEEQDRAAPQERPSRQGRGRVQEQEQEPQERPDQDVRERPTRQDQQKQRNDRSRNSGRGRRDDAM